MPVDLNDLSNNQILINLPKPYTKGKIYTLIGKASKIKDGDYYKHNIVIKPIGEITDEDTVTKYLNAEGVEVPEVVKVEDDMGIVKEIPNQGIVSVEVNVVSKMSFREQGLECFKKQLKDFIIDIENILKGEALDKAVDVIEEQIENQTEDIELSKGEVL